jgi:AraC-like DNA-binding protein
MDTTWKTLAQSRCTFINGHRVARRPGLTPIYCVDGWSLNVYGLSGQLITLDGRIPIHRLVMVVFPPGYQRQFLFETSGLHDAIHFDTPLVPPTKPLLGIWHHRTDPDLADLAMEDLFESWPSDPERSTHLLGTIFHAMAKELERPRTPAGSLVDRAMSMIRRRHDRDLGVAELARELDVSHNHLTRQFRQERDETVIAAIRRVRMERAEELICHTDLPIHVIAEDVGLPDLQRFNKTVHKFHGCSPRQLRKRKDMGSDRT